MFLRKIRFIVSIILISVTLITVAACSNGTGSSVDLSSNTDSGSGEGAVSGSSDDAVQDEGQTVVSESSDEESQKESSDAENGKSGSDNSVNPDFGDIKTSATVAAAEKQLKTVIDKIIAYVNTLDVITSGEYVYEGCKWVSSELYDQLYEKLLAAQTCLANDASHTKDDLDKYSNDLVDFMQSEENCFEDQVRECSKSTVVITSLSQDGSKIETVTDDSYLNEYEPDTGSSSTQCVEQIIRNGSLYVNCIKLPEDEDAFEDELDGVYKINEETWMEKQDSGYSVKGNSYSDYYQACTALIECIPAGNEVFLTDTDGDEYCDCISVFCKETFVVGTMKESSDGIEICRAEIEGVDDSDIYGSSMFTQDEPIIADESDVDPSLSEGDVALAYYGSQGWIVDRAYEINGVLMESSEDTAYEIDENFYAKASGFDNDSLIVSSQAENYIAAFTYFNFFNSRYRVSLWSYKTEDGQVCPAFGFTSGENASVFLENAIEQAENVMSKVYVRGTDSQETNSENDNSRWVTEEEYNLLSAAIEQAREAIDSSAPAVELDYNIYHIYKVIADSTDKLKNGNYGHLPDTEDNQLSKSSMIIIFAVIVGVVLAGAVLLIVLLMLKKKKQGNDASKTGSIK